MGRTATSGVSDCIPASNCSRNASTATATSPMSLPGLTRCAVGRRPLFRALACAATRAGTAKVKRKVPSLPPARCQIGPLLCESPLGSIPPGRQRLPRVTGGRGEAPHRDREGHDCTREVTRGESRWRTHTTVRPLPPPFPPLAPHGRIFTPRECPSRIREFPPAPTTPHPPDPHLR